jgi:ATP-dependent DNA ligase
MHLLGWGLPANPRRTGRPGGHRGGAHGASEIAAAEGAGSQGRKVELLARLLARATPLEARYLLRLVTRSLRSSAPLDRGANGMFASRCDGSYGDM